MDNKYIARPCKNCKVIDCCFKGHENDFEICEDYTATNGDMIKAMFPNARVSEIYPSFNGDEVYYVPIEKVNGVTNEMRVMKSWWNAPYKKEAED